MVRQQHTSYGLQISANRPVPGLRPATFAERDADVRVELGPFPASVAARGGSPQVPWLEGDEVLDGLVVTTLLDGEGVRFRYEWGVEALIDLEARTLWVAWDTHRSIEDAALLLTGPLLGFFLRLLGRTCLHASAVTIVGTAVALVGPSEVGKSTLAWALGRRGHGVLADDVVLLEEANGQFLAVPAHGRLRVWPDAVAHFEGALSARPPLIDDWEKQYVDLLDGSLALETAPMPLGAICLLQPSEPGTGAPRVRRLRPTEAVPHLAANTYRAELLSPAMRAQEFACLTRLVERVPVVRVSYETGLANLPSVCQAIVVDVRTTLP